ncbi:non-ribosomal peptide synthetase, partial [Bacillus cereus]
MSVFKKQELFWNSMFDAEDNMSYLPYVKAIKNTSNKYDYVYSPLSSNVSQKIKTMANGSNLAIYLILLTGVECLINKYTDEENIIIGFPTMQVGDKQGSLLNEFLILKNKLDQNSTFKSIFNRIKLLVKETIENQKIPFKKMVRNLNLQYDSNNLPIINTMVSLKEIHQDTFNKGVVTDTIFHFDLEKDVINLKLIYNENLYDRDFMNQIIEHLNRVFSVILYQYDLELSKVELLSEVEKNKLLISFNDTTFSYPKKKALHQLFEEQVYKTPDQLAIVFENQQLTYWELNERANQLARTLRNQGVKENQLVGIMVERSVEMIVGILGVLKAGGAYVPIDPEYPEDRINYMLKDSGVEILLSQQHLRIPFSYKNKTLLLDDAHTYHEDASNLGGINTENQLAYLIYTSGTTGNPKGVMVEHSSIHNTVQWKAKSYGFTKDDRVLMFSTFVFDSFITHFFGPIISGSTVYILNDKQCIDPTEIKNAIALWQITHLQSTPNFLFKVLENMDGLDFHSIKNVVVGGEKITPVLIKKLKTLNPTVEICNEYGPTENSVISTMLSITNVKQTLSIGKPISNVKIFIFGKNNCLQPINVPGELCISGDGIAKGYLNQPVLTAEKFVENPFIPGECMYRTGDLAKWLPDGNIEYIGRIDDQVKIRGYRIELGEVESALQKLELVRESIVVARETEDGIKQLCAYFVGDESLTVGQLREAMSQELPDYMIPSYFVQLTHMPLTPNGKIDRKALPEPEGNIQTGTEYVAPQTPIEEMLVSIWQTVLGVSQIGVLDNFFDLGGDSIKSIQVSSRLYQAGYRVDMKNLFKYSTVESLSPYVEKITRVAEQGKVTGKTMLTPIQRWYFDREAADPQHFNQAFLLYRKQSFDVAALRKTIQKIAEHHDALRMVFDQTEHGYEAWNRGIEEEELFSLEVMDLTENRNPASVIEKAANAIQSSMHLSEGPLMKLGLFQCEEGDHLLMVIHHLVVDGVSWRILLEDFEAGYEQAVNGKDIQLPQKTDSFQLWAEQLSLYANSPEMEKEREYWNEVEQIPTGLLPKDAEQDCGLIKDTEVISVQWTASETGQLLKQANRAYNTEINDLLLTALGMAVHQWTGMENIVVNLEGHGRESILSDLDITRTVGWFTSQYPVILPIEVGSNISHQIKNIKEGFRHIPNKGIGYGLLKYLSENQEKQTFTMNPEISFNYLGQFDQDLENTAMQASPYSSGSDISQYQMRAYVLEINGMISNGKLSLGIGYNGKQYQKETIEKLADWLHTSLQEVIEHCVTKERTELTPSDIIFKGMTIEALDRIVQETKHIGEIENVYPLTPMQNGMLFHSLLNSQSEAYFEQATFDVQGSMNVKAF